MNPVVVVGGGWAGLAAAAELCRRRVPVLLLEAAHQTGGRARRVYYGGKRLDSGQHLFLGAFRKTLQLINAIGVPESRVFERQPLQLRIRSPQRDIRLLLGRYPAPLHLVRGLQSITGLSLTERLRAVGLGVSLARRHFTVQNDINVAAWLESHHQTQALIHGIWEPLCMATLNTAVHQASTQVFLRVLHDAFIRSSEDSDLLIPKTDLSAILPDPAVAYMERHGGTVRLDTVVTALEIEDDRITGVRTPTGVERADRVILALPYSTCRRLLTPHPVFADIARQLSRLTPTPITTVYLEYPRPVRLDAPFVGIVNGTPRWLFDRARYGQQGLISVVISGPGPHTDMDNDTLVNRVATGIAKFYPHWPAHENSVVLREMQATFACSTGVNAVRPGNDTPVRGCWLAGDYTATGYPATLEGAVVSGLEAAGRVIHSLP